LAETLSKVKEDAEEGRSSNGDGDGQADTHLGDFYCSTGYGYSY
jgi:hypothetical protein